MVLNPRVVASTITVLPNSGTNNRFFCRLICFLTLPVGLNLVARVLFEYPPPTTLVFLVIAHVFITVFACYHRIYMNAIDTIFFLAVLIMSVVIHEVSHGFMAEYLGDKTARLAGRLTLNPIRHLDLFGSVILPAILYFSTGFAFGWARPVPYNPANLRNERWGTVAVAAAGILANIFIALFFGLMLRGLYPGYASENLVSFVSSIVFVNLALAFFNLVPIPPLDGSKILFGILPFRFSAAVNVIERYSLFLLIAFIFFFSQYLSPIIIHAFQLITGINL